MKNYIKYILLIFLVPFLAGCEDLLEEEVYSSFAPSNFYKNADDAEAAIMGVYGTLLSGDQFLYTQHLPTLTVHPGGCLSQEAVRIEDNLQWTSSWAMLSRFWSAHYRAINRANSVLKYVPPIEMDEAENKRIQAEARLIRALLYFNLVQWFGGVPIHSAVTESLENTSLPRSPVSDVYELIIEDLDFAEDYLPDPVFPGNGRFTSGAAKALLAKVYLTMAGEPLKDTEKLALAKEKLLELVDPSDPANGKAPFNYMLEPDYRRLYWQISQQRVPLLSANENGPEGVFEFNFSIVESQWGAIWCNSRIRKSTVSNWYRDQFEPGDYRLEVSCITAPGDPRGQRYLQIKWPLTGSTWYNHESNWYLIRFADVLLMYAEVENELNGPSTSALNCLNAVRERARNNADTLMATVPGDYTLGDAPDKSTLRDLILRERVLELGIEGHLWFDMVRTGRLESLLEEQDLANNYQREYNPRIKLFPLPQTEIDISKGVLTQNPGY